jgi:type I restriction enzyme S subunit
MRRPCLLGEAITLKRGYDLPHQMRQEGSVPIVSSAGITGTHAECKVHGPGVVTGRYGTLGEIHYVASDFWPLNTTLYVQDFKGNDPRFVSYLLRTLDFGSRSGAAAVPGVNRNDLHRLPIVLPDVEEQRRIASILSAYDDLIENNTRRIGILEEMARRIYEEWFVRCRFPGHEQLKRVESELGLIPEGWRVGSLGEAAAINARSIRPADAPLEILYIDIASVVPGAITQKQPYRFSEAPGRARRVVGHGDVIWSCVRPNRRSYALILQPEPALIASTGFAVLSAKSVPYSYLYFAVTTDDFVGFLTNHATGAAYPAVTASTFEAAPFLIPEEEVADQFHAVVAPMLDLSETLKRKNANLRATRDLLLPKLISGELDVSTLPEPEAA